MEHGRKDVGGIVGQAEPYVAIDLSEDIAYQLTESINKLHDLIDKMLEDSGSESETLSNCLTIIQSFADNSDIIQSAADRYADNQYKANHNGNTYRIEVDDAIQTMYDITIKYTNQMSDSAIDGAEAAFNHAKDAAGNMETAGAETKRFFNDINGREDINVEYVRYLTTLAGGPIRENGQSVLLADGQFQTDDVLNIVQEQIEDTSGLPENVTELLSLVCPEDGNAAHQIRYQAPEGQTKGVEIYVHDGNTWKQTDTEMMGIYYLFQIEGENAQIAVVVADKNWTVYFALGAVVVLLIIVGVVILIRKKKKRKTTKQN